MFPFLFRIFYERIDQFSFCLYGLANGFLKPFEKLRITSFKTWSQIRMHTPESQASLLKWVNQILCQEGPREREIEDIYS